MYGQGFSRAAMKRPDTAGEGDLPLPRPAKHVALSRKEIGERLRALREQRRMTQVELATIIDTHQVSVSQIERGVRGVSLQQVVKLARALRVSPDSLLGVGKNNGGRPAPRNERLMRRVRRIEQLPVEQQEAAIKILDGFLGAQRR